MVKRPKKHTAPANPLDGAVPPYAEVNDEDMAARAVEIRTTYGKGVAGALEAGAMLAAYQEELADRRQFKRFWKDILKWPKTRVYRLIDAQRYFAHLPPETLGMFDLSALYTLSGEGAKEEARTKAIQEATGGGFITNARANKLLGRVARTTNGTPGTLRVTRRKLNAEAKKLDLDAEKVVELLEKLGVTVDWQGKRSKAKVGA